jgi:hypothetical protein
MENNSLARIVNALYVPLVFICVGISTWASYNGIKISLGQLAYFGAALIGLVLFASDLAMNDAKRNGKPLYKALIAFSFALIFSTASNFNFFYTQYIEQSFSKANYLRAVNQFEQNIRSAVRRLSEDPDINETEQRLSELGTLKLNLRKQVLDPGRPGVGPRAREIVENIRRLLPQMTDIAPPSINSSTDELEEWVDRFETLVDANFRKTVPEVLQNYYDLRKDMDKWLQFYKDRITNFQDGNANNETAVTLIENMATKIAEYETKVNRIVDSPRWQPPQRLQPARARIGEIVETFKSVFSKSGDIAVALWSLVLSMFIDLIPLIYALTLIRPIEPEQVGLGRSLRTGRRFTP